MEIIKFVSGPFMTNSYLLVNNNKGILIDAPYSISTNINAILEEKQIDLEKIILTHSHWDHTAETGLLAQKYKAQVLIHKEDEQGIIDKKYHNSIYINPKIQEEFIEVMPTKYIQDNMKLQFSDDEMVFLHTPGHTLGGVSIYFKEQNVLFSGDTLFQLSIGRTDLAGGNTNQIIQSIKDRLLVLPDDTIVYPGHGESTSIKYERDNNQFLQG